MPENITERQIQSVLRKVFKDRKIVYSRDRFAGGLTNYNYIIDIHGESYVVREPGLKTEEMIDRHAERLNIKQISSLCIDSETVYFDEKTGIKVSRFISDASNFGSIGPSYDICLSNAAHMLRSLHRLKKPFKNTFDWQVEADRYEKILKELGGSIFFDYHELKERLIRAFDRVTCWEKIACHNDTVPENFLRDTVSGKSYLIDWEYSGINDPTWDVAMYILESRLQKPAIDSFLQYYYGNGEPDKDTMWKLKLMCLAQDLLWSLWAVVRHYGGEDFLEYLSTRYERFRFNMNRLREDPDYPLSEMVLYHH